MSKFDELEKKIAPFKLVEGSTSASVIMSDVGSYKQNIFDAREDEGFIGNGYDWASLADVFLHEKLPQLAKDIKFDPEADMFCAYSANPEALLEFAEKFFEMCQDDVSMADLFSRAELD